MKEKHRDQSVISIMPYILRKQSHEALNIVYRDCCIGDDASTKSYLSSHPALRKQLGYISASECYRHYQQTIHRLARQPKADASAVRGCRQMLAYTKHHPSEYYGRFDDGRTQYDYGPLSADIMAMNLEGLSSQLENGNASF